MRSSFKFFTTAFLTFAVLAFPLFSFAHAVGYSWEKIVDSYKLDVGYDTTNFVSGQTARFDFNVLKSTDGSQVDFTDAWVRISQDNNTVFASGINRPVFGLAGMIFVFPAPGNYDLDVRFEKGDNNIVESDFPISVKAADAPPVKKSSALYLEIAGAGVLGLIIGFVVRGLFKKTKSS